jgi:hypothetical protein
MLHCELSPVRRLIRWMFTAWTKDRAFREHNTLFRPLASIQLALYNVFRLCKDVCTACRGKSYSSAITVELLTVFVYITCSDDVVIRVLQTSEHTHFEVFLCLFCGWHTECWSVRCQTSAATNMNTSYEAGNRDGAYQTCKIFGDNSVSIFRRWFVKTQWVSDTSGTGVTLLIALHNGIIVTRMEMGMTTGVNRKHFVCVRVGACVRGVQHRHDGSFLVLRYNVPQLACVIIHKQIACARRTKLIFLILVHLVLKCGAVEVSRRSVGPIVREMRKPYRHSRNIL